MTSLPDNASTPRVCVIGAGPCGIACVKNLLEQGLENIDVFEKNNRIGGNWVYDEKGVHSSVYETTHLISSRWLSWYEDFPMPPGTSEYPSHEQVLHYFEVYAARFGMARFVRFETCVEKVEPLDDKRWHVTYRDALGLHTAVYDYVMVANGHHWDPSMPEYPGTFSGEMLHAHAYKKAEPFRGKRVLVVGGGNSACDIAVEVARVARKSCISMRRGQHIIPKFLFGKPSDTVLARIKWLPHRLRQIVAGTVLRALQGHYGKYRLQKPRERLFASHPTINSELLYAIRHGKVFPCRGIERFEGSTVYFTDGAHEDFDAVIFATGYKTTFPFFAPELIDYSHAKQLPLYLKMMHPTFETLYFIGLFQPQGCIWPLADYQAGIAARIMAGTRSRPKRLEQKIQREIKAHKARFHDSPRHALEVDYHTFRRQLRKALKA